MINNTQIPSILFDYWMKKLSPVQFKVLLCLVYKRFNHKEDKSLISIKEIEEKTNLSKERCVTCVHFLENLGLLKEFNILIVTD